ncbi:hypothetical protein B7463_g3005, partial [Scytalidium lignicola]
MNATKIVQAYQDVPSNSWQFKLRLIEVVAFALHTLAGTIYQSNHPEVDIYTDSESKETQIPHYYLDFYHMAYMAYGEYPRGVLNMIGYWIETRIFGGVILVEHDETECEAKSIFLYTQRSDIFQLSETQVYGILSLDRNNSLPFTPEPNAKKLTRNQLNGSHVFRDDFSRIYPFNLPIYRCVVPMTDHDRELIKWVNDNSSWSLAGTPGHEWKLTTEPPEPCKP